MPAHPPLSTLADVAVASSGTHARHCYPEWHNFPVYIHINGIASVNMKALFLSPCTLKIAVFFVVVVVFVFLWETVKFITHILMYFLRLTVFLHENTVNHASLLL